MAQKNGKRAPVYSADALALRFLAGFTLIALGVMMLLAVVMRLSGNVFVVLRQTCYGLAGGLAILLPVLPIWAGVLVIWSSQRKAPVRPFLFAMLAFLGICAFIVLVTRIGNEEYLTRLSRMSDGTWGGVIHGGYIQSIQLRASGGTLGILLAYPLWTLIGPILSIGVTSLLAVFCILQIFGLTPGRIRDLAAGRLVIRWGRKPKDQAEQDQRQIHFQQEQEQRRQMAWAQQQAAQQAVEPNPQGTGEWQQHRGWTQPQPAMVAAGSNVSQDMLDWQQLSGVQAMQNGGTTGQSQIFDGKDANKRSSQRQPASMPDQKKQRWTSRIFGVKPEQEDGLVDASARETSERQYRDRMSRTGGGRRTVSGSQIGETATAWNAADQDERVRELYADSFRKNRPMKPQEAEKPAEDENEIAEPKLIFARKPEPNNEEEQPARRPAKKREEARNTDEQLEAQIETGSGQMTSRTGKATAGPGRVSSKWLSQLADAEEKAEKLSTQSGAAKPRTETIADSLQEERSAKPVKVTVAKDTIADPTWKPELKRVTPKEEPEEDTWWEPTPYYAPPITDLKKPDLNVLDTSLEDEERSRRLEATLASFKVQTRVVHVTHGPAISRFELELAPGTKVGKVAALDRDIASGMQATSVRIEAPIPGKSLVGVEVPNASRATVTLRELLESSQMQNAKSILTVALGKDIAGAPVVCDLAKMPHLLIAGATGSGKSVCINTIINSLLFRASPDEVKMILVDPKVVELQCYNGIPHLLLPVVNDPHKAAAALAWAVAEMMERYDKFAERGVRNLDGYNNSLEDGEKPMPRLVIIIDELADLMMVCKKDVEEYICRLTQLARAAGIHLIVATQRPSVDVITGLIKANIPSRIAFKTASSVDSRTILDHNGSEELLGMGDMLYLPTGSFAPTRVQGCFLSDEEVNRIADHVRQANPSTYDPNVLDKLEQLSKGTDDTPTADLIGGGGENVSGDAELFAQAVEIAIQDGQVSTSTLQRRLRVGYSRAGRLTDELEARGIISAKDGSKPRKTLITREEWVALQEQGQ